MLMLAVAQTIQLRENHQPTTSIMVVSDSGNNRLLTNNNQLSLSLGIGFCALRKAYRLILSSSEKRYNTYPVSVQVWLDNFD